MVTRQAAVSAACLFPFSSMQQKKIFLFLWAAILLAGLSMAAARPPAADPVRIVSLDGTVSEILCGLGLQAYLIGVDVTSTYPASLAKLPKVGHNRNISAEGVLACNLRWF